MPELKPREAEVLIYQGDDLARLAELRQAAEVAQRRVERDEKSPRRTGDEVPSADEEKAAFDAFVEEAASIRTIVEPEFPTKAALTRFLDDQITEGDFDTLWLTAFGANRGASGNPLDHRYSTGSRSSTET